MRSTSQIRSNDRIEPDSPTTIPDFARAWESANQVTNPVRRPSTLPDPESYHQAIDPEAIFELDERQKDGSIKTILVVAFGCKRCKYSLKQACSRAQPLCARCKSARLGCCEAFQEGYQRLPGPKFPRSRQPKDGAREGSIDGEPLTQKISAGRLRARRTASRMIVYSSDSESSDTPGSKRPLSPGSASVPPRKRAHAKTASRKGKAQRSTTTTPDDMDVNYSDTLSSARGVSTCQRGGLKWSFMKRDLKYSSQGQEHARSTPSNTQIPRVWTNSLGGLLTVFPDLGKSTIGFSWLQSETPILLLETNYDRGRWINATTLEFDLSWEFSCDHSELEPVVELNVGERSPRPHFLPTDTLVCNIEIEKMGLHYSYSPPGIESFPAHEAMSAPSSAFATMPSFDAVPQDICPGAREYYAGETSSIYPTIQDSSASTASSTQLHPSDHPSRYSPSSQSCLVLNETPNQYTTFEPNIPPRVPRDKPPEVETLSDSHLRFIPVLLWISRDSELMPSNLPSEYAYLCMGLFFISDLRRAVVQHSVSSTGLVHGQVCWSVTLQWAPGGEDALFECDSAPLSNVADPTPLGPTRDLLRPWWLDPTDMLSQSDGPIPYRPRDLQMQFFSFIPLDLLAEFHPSESFPRGWFCKSCGMINIQIYFRHQICQSTTCRSTRDKCIPPGKVDRLSSLRDLYQSSGIIRPTSKTPSTVVSESVTWDDGMQSWIHRVKNGVTLCHVFTGNQEHLQTDATELLETIQCEVLLHKEDCSSPYFTHRTRLSHPSDGSETTVPVGTPNCIRIAYYTLCDFVYRYAEMDKPRFGEVRILAWVNSGSKKGNVFHASKSPVVVHCLGAGVVLKFTPRGGYEDAAKLSAIDKGKERANDQDRIGSRSPEPCAGPSRHMVQVNGNQMVVIPALEANETPTVAENVDEDINAAVDTVGQYSSRDGGIAIATSDSNMNHGTEVAQQGVERRGHKKNKVTNDKTKAPASEISMTLVHGDCVVLSGDDFAYQLVRTGTTILVIGIPEET